MLVLQYVSAGFVKQFSFYFISDSELLKKLRKKNLGPFSRQSGSSLAEVAVQC
jgi:hypothetical protein